MARYLYAVLLRKQCPKTDADGVLAGNLADKGKKKTSLRRRAEINQTRPCGDKKDVYELSTRTRKGKGLLYKCNRKLKGTGEERARGTKRC